MALFDFETQAGITHVLASIRASSISPAQKNELRDIVFLYANGGHDQTVKLSLEQKLGAYAIAALPKKYAAPKAPMYTIGGTRQTPDEFAVVNSVKVSQHPPPPIAAQYVPPAPVVPQPAPYIPPVAQVVPPTPPVSQYVPPAQVATVSPPSPPPIAAQYVPPAPAQAAPLPPQPVAVEFPPAGEQQLQRIREIKSLVNEQVGNPVNLIDIDNEAGREYMGALLDAMKKLNTGTSSVAAMQRLEQAYKTVDAAIKRHKGVVAQSNIKPLTQSIPVQSVPIPPPAPIQAAPLPSAASYVPPAPVTAPKPVPPPVAAPQPVIPPHVVPPAIPRPIPLPVAAPYVPPTPVVPPSQRVVPPPLPPAAPISVPIRQVEDASSAWDSNKPSASAYADSKLTSLAESKLRAQSTIAPSTAPSAPTDPLFAPEIDSGLDQLLSEWSLFKKSGLFGTGPNGKEHPLFKKIAGLQIPLLLAGRFEGATQEIKQSITDYMNGWRYEQGIIYMPGETFERYLRRVIRHILDLQKKLPRS